MASCVRGTPRVLSALWYAWGKDELKKVLQSASAQLVRYLRGDPLGSLFLTPLPIHQVHTLKGTFWTPVLCTGTVVGTPGTPGDHVTNLGPCQKWRAVAHSTGAPFCCHYRSRGHYLAIWIIGQIGWPQAWKETVNKNWDSLLNKQSKCQEQAHLLRKV